MVKEKKLVLICDVVEPLLISGLEEMGYEVKYHPKISNEEVFENASRLTGIVINTRTPVRATLMEKSTQLEWVARLGSGLDIIDLDVAKKRGIEVINSPEGNANAVAEHVLGMILNLLRNINQADLEIRSGRWEREGNRGRELSNCVVGIIGFGNTGSAFAKVLSGFGCKILAYDKYRQQYDRSFRFVKECNSVDQVLRESDIVSLHLPLTSETYEMVDDAFLKRCKKDCIIVNSSRGNLLVVSSLLNSIANGHIKGACLDVFPNEKLETLSKNEKRDFKELKKNRQILMTPHIAGWTVESKIKISEILLHKIKTLGKNELFN